MLGRCRKDKACNGERDSALHIIPLQLQWENHKQLWLFLLVYIVGSLVAIVAGLFAVFAISPPITQQQAAHTFGLVVLGWSCLTLIPVLSVYAKRLHDRRRSGWWLLVPLVPSTTLALIWPSLSAAGLVPPGSSAWFLLPFAPFFGWLAVLGLISFFTSVTSMKMLVLVAAPVLALANLWILVELGFLRGRRGAEELSPLEVDAPTASFASRS